MTTAVVAEDVERILSEKIDWSELAGRTVLVTGAAGMIGQYVVRTLAELGGRARRPSVVALTRQAARARRLFADHLDAGHVRLLVQDVTSPLELREPVDYIVHAASPANPVAFRSDPVGVIRANTTGTDNVLSLAAQHGAVVCLVSTMEIYGRPVAAGDQDGVLVGEVTPGCLDGLDARSAYPESKRLAENLCVAYHSQHGVGYRIARLSHTYGPGMDLQDSRVQAYFLRQALAGDDIVLESDGTLRRTYTYVSDAVSALFFLLCARDNLTCNVANEAARVSIRELAETVLRHGRPGGGRVRVQFRTPPPAPGPENFLFLDCTRLRRLGWAPRVDLSSGIGRTLRHHRAEAAG